MRTPEAEKKYRERWNRMEAAIHLEKPKDRIPTIMMGHIPAARVVDPDIIPYDIIERPDYFLEKTFEGYEGS